MTRDHSAAAWTPDWLGEAPETADERPTGPAHAAPDPETQRGLDGDTETREIIDLGQYEQAEHVEIEKREHDKRERAQVEPRRPLKSDGWAEEREPGWADGLVNPADPSVGSLRSLGAVAVTGRRATRPPASPRSSPRRGRNGGRGGSAYGLVALVLLGLMSAFFAWVTAEPVWLTVGHAEAGTVTVTRCAGDRCLGTFTGTGFARDAIPVMGDAPAAGEQVPAEMTSRRGANAYVGVDPASRAGMGIALIVLCGLGIVRATGVRRLPTRPARRIAALLSVIAPFTLLAAMLAVTY
jgi:hypothetical protein